MLSSYVVIGIGGSRTVFFLLFFLAVPVFLVILDSYVFFVWIGVEWLETEEDSEPEELLLLLDEDLDLFFFEDLDLFFF